MDQLAKRDEVYQTGIYLLVGSDPAFPGRSAIYIGEGDAVIKRILSHDKDASKEFWDRAIVFVASNKSLNKAHVRFLEAQLISIASSAKRATITNGNEPVGGHISEADAAEMIQFLENIKLLSSMLMVDAFEDARVSLRLPAASELDVAFQMAGEGFAAEMIPDDGEFVVRKGGVARLAEAPTLSNSSKSARAELEATGVLLRTANGLVFTQDYAFRSVSGAAQVVCGNNVSGNITWKLNDGTQYKDWMESKLQNSAAA